MTAPLEDTGPSAVAVEEVYLPAPPAVVLPGEIFPVPPPRSSSGAAAAPAGPGPAAAPAGPGPAEEPRESVLSEALEAPVAIEPDWVPEVPPGLPEPPEPEDPLGGPTNRLPFTRRWVAVGSVGALIAALVLSLGLLGGSGHSDSRTGRSTSGASTAGTATGGSPAVAAASAAGPAPVALVVPDGSGGSAMVAVLVPATAGGTVFIVPPGAMQPIGSFGLQPLGAAVSLGGAGRVQTSLENLFGFNIGSTVVADPATLSSLVAPASPMRIDVPEGVEQTDSSGQVVIALGAGPAEVSASQVPALVSSLSDGGDVSRLSRQAAFFAGWIAAVAKHPSQGPPPGSPLAGVLASLVRGTLHEQLVPVQPLGQSDSGQELYQVETSALATMVRSAMPAGSSEALFSAPAGRSARPSVQVLNGTGHLQVAAAVADRLVPAGWRVALVGNAGSSGFAHTQIVYYRPSDQALAAQAAAALGVGQLVLDSHPIGVVDITVIVGKDYRTRT